MYVIIQNNNIHWFATQMNTMFIYSMTTLLKIHTIYVQISFQPEAVMEIPFGWLGRNAEGIPWQSAGGRLPSPANQTEFP